MSQEARSHLSSWAPNPNPSRDHSKHLTFSLHWSINFRAQTKVTIGLYPAALIKPSHQLPQISFHIPSATLQNSLDFHYKGVTLYTLTYSRYIPNVLFSFHILFCKWVSPGWHCVTHPHMPSNVALSRPSQFQNGKTLSFMTVKMRTFHQMN